MSSRCVTALSSLLLVLPISVPAPAAGVPGRTDVERKRPANDDVFCWIPKWREKGDCGPVALYILLSIEGKKITLERVKKAVPPDAVKGCSMSSLLRAAGAFGLPMDVRFVRPGALAGAPCPFILHGITSQEKNLGHFLIVVDFDSKAQRFAVIDPARESFEWFPEKSILSGYSGYILTPRASSSGMWSTIIGALSVVCACYVLWITYSGSLRALLARRVQGVVTARKEA